MKLVWICLTVIVLFAFIMEFISLFKKVKKAAKSIKSTASECTSKIQEYGEVGHTFPDDRQLSVVRPWAYLAQHRVETQDAVQQRKKQKHEDHKVIWSRWMSE